MQDPPRLRARSLDRVRSIIKQHINEIKSLKSYNFSTEILYKSINLDIIIDDRFQP